MKYKVDYFYLAQGMHKADEVNYGIIEADSAEHAKDVLALKEVPNDRMYGPKEMWSVREFFKGCLTAKAFRKEEIKKLSPDVEYTTS